MRNGFFAWLHAGLDLIAPRSCPGCDLSLDDDAPDTTGFCGACAPLLEPTGGPYSTSDASPYWFVGPLADAIRRYKYGARTELTEPLSALLVPEAARFAGAVDVVVPVPLHPSRLRDRGFNQAALLGRPVARALGVPLGVSLLRRVRATPPQASLDADGRAANVRRAFAASAIAVRGKVILLVDDVRTTGSTLAACGSALLDAGASRVCTLTLARAPP